MKAALILLENSISGSPSKIPFLALGGADAGTNETHEMMLRMQEDKLMADLETVLGIDGLSHMGDFMAIIEREKRHQDTRV